MLAFATKWGPAPRLARRIPFGYTVDPNDEKVLLPVVFELEALAEAAEFLAKGHSLRSVARWLSGKTGRDITHEGLKRRVNHDKTDNRRALTTRRWAESIAQAAKEVREFDLKKGNSTEWYDGFVRDLVETLQRQAEEG